jgi:hypothetical protein
MYVTAALFGLLVLRRGPTAAQAAST